MEMRDISIQRIQPKKPWGSLFMRRASSVLSTLSICNYRPRKTGKSTHLANIELQALEGCIRDALGKLRTSEVLAYNGR